MADEHNLDQTKFFQEAIARLHQSWQTSGDALLTDFLPPPASPLRLPLLHELIGIDLNHRWQNRLPTLLEQYQERYPELGPTCSFPVILLVAEFHARHRHGDRPAPATYRARFPEQYPQFLEILDQNTLLNQTGTQVPSTASLGPPAPLPVHAGVQGPPLLPPGEGYTLLERIGAGQFGEVWRARAPGGVEVAVKRIIRSLDDESRQREQQAAKLIRSLRHPFLLQTQAFWNLPEQLVIVMELADGSLNDRFKECRKAGLTGIPAPELLSYFAQAADALDYLHSQHVVHRDIKPANLLRLKGYAKVADFGLARLHDTHMAAATFCGTPVYMAPETWRGRISIHSDQYSLAATYAEMRLGRRIYAATDPMGMALAHEQGNPNLAPLEKAEEKVLLQALAANPDKRFPSCRDFVRALAEALAPPAKPPSRPSRVPRLLLGLIVVLGATLAGLILRLSLFPKTPPQGDPAPLVWLPPNYEPAPDTKRIGPYHERIVYPLKEADPLVFVLIPRKNADDPPTFYMLRDKVSNEQFRAIVGDPRMQELLRQYAGAYPWTIRDRRGLPVTWVAKIGLLSAPQGPLLATGPLVSETAGAWEKEGRDPKKSKRPVFDVTVVEAHCFAECLHGRLPSGRQWDKAGGKFDGAAGPFKPDWKEGEIALNLDQSRDIGTSPGDVSIFDCRDLAGNGREWTRDLANEEPVVPLTAPRNGDSVALRGREFWRTNPYTFTAAVPPAVRYGETANDLGFRVVLEPPPEP
jgi:serine/threonine protein kinase/formylglycine-generating enzyme required for sulfatase activity